MEIVQERLEREFNMTVITTVPSVKFRALLTNGKVIEINAPSEMPDPTHLSVIEEPYIAAQIITKADYIGPLSDSVWTSGVSSRIRYTSHRIALN
jgi:GTP-binding protein LepA